MNTSEAVEKRKRSGITIVMLTAVLAFGTAAIGQNYRIDSFTVDGGGGTSTGGVYSVSGTLGQAESGPTLAGGNFILTGGFWALPIAVQTTNAPTLLVTPTTPGLARISWAPETPGWVLQEAWSLSPANWSNCVTGATNPVVVPDAFPTKFYRLNKP